MFTLANQLELVQEKLDVKSKFRSNIFNWRGQFTPQFVDYIVDSFAKSGDVVVDPFSGSGTVLSECARKDISCFGFEINPAAYIMSKFFSVSNEERRSRLELLSNIKETINELYPHYEGLPLYLETELYRDSYQNLLHYTRELISKLQRPIEKVLALNMLFLCDNNKEGDLNSNIIKAYNYIEKATMYLPYSDYDIDAFLCDARIVDKKSPKKANIIFTSPPYINVFNYHQNYRAIIETVGWNVLKVAQSEFGSNRKNRGNRFKTVVQYCFDMEESFKSFWNLLNSNGIIVMVIGKESNVRRVPFYNGRIVRDIVSSMGGFKELATYQRNFINKFGNSIKEDILIWEKSSVSPSQSRAREVALKHLNLSLFSSDDSVKADILDAIENIDTIVSSPVLHGLGGKI